MFNGADAVELPRTKRFGKANVSRNRWISLRMRCEDMLKLTAVRPNWGCGVAAAVFAKVFRFGAEQAVGESLFVAVRVVIVVVGIAVVVVVVEEPTACGAISSVFRRRSSAGCRSTGNGACRPNA